MMMGGYVFGPVVSRRLGVSLGINNVPYKTCTYSCIYCQLGRTTCLTVERRSFHDWRELVERVADAVRRLEGKIDYATFVPDGEPLLDMDLGREVRAIREECGAKVAILTNASLLLREDCRADAAEADLVSVKVDALHEGAWKKVNRPHPALKLERVLEGVLEFSREYGGRLIAETMLVDGFNTGLEELKAVADFLAGLKPAKAYIAIPIRPPAEPYARPPSPAKLLEAFEVFADRLGSERVELLSASEPPPPLPRADPVAWLLSTVSVHPLKLEHALGALKRAGKDPLELLAELEARGFIEIVEYRGSKFIVRGFGDFEER